jgi:5-oxopent-3-ene-1,2,5-tricarboxylate decarboxylase / 2-hydroxyhepta-2,4-diene-1,7-dioate isomerase
MASQYFPTGTVYGVLLNFSAERAALATQMLQPPYKAPPQAPVLYVKTANTWSVNGASVPVPARVSRVEIGATVAMVIGPVTRYVLINDLSIPHASFFRPPVKFKCLDGFLGIGPQLLTADDPASFKLEVRINGDLQQTVDFSNLVRNVQTLIRDVAQFMTLRDGDVLMLGCDCLPGGGRPLAEVGDVIQISAPSHPALGVLTNTLVAEKS